VTTAPWLQHPATPPVNRPRRTERRHPRRGPALSAPLPPDHPRRVEARRLEAQQRADERRLAALDAGPPGFTLDTSPADRDAYLRATIERRALDVARKARVARWKRVLRVRVLPADVAVDARQRDALLDDPQPNAPSGRPVDDGDRSPPDSQRSVDTLTAAPGAPSASHVAH
jgi:hypothetical protein